MSDYLWDRTGSPDPEVARLERLLAPLALPVGADPAPILARARRARWVRRGAWAAVAAAALVALLVPWPSRPAWDVDRVDGAPRIGAAVLASKGRWRVGDWLETDAFSRARVRVGEIGEVVVDPRTRVRLLNADEREHRLALKHGVLHASVSAPPRLFLVETPAALAADLGCAYTISVRPDGHGSIRVTAGAVSLEGKTEAYVPAGASCTLQPNLGPGIPAFADAPAALREALSRFEAGEAAALSELLANIARPRDTLTLWHLLPRAADPARAEVFDRLQALAPGGPDRARTLALEPAALEAWRTHLQSVWWVGGLPAKLRKAVTP